MQTTMSYWLRVALVWVTVMLTACGGGGGGTSPSGTTGSSGVTDSGNTGTPPPPSAPPASTDITVSVSSGAPVIALSSSLRTFSLPYAASYQAAQGSVWTMVYNRAADELVIGGNVLEGGAPGVMGLDPLTLNVRWSIATTSFPDVVAVSADGSTAFVGLCDEYKIAQLDLASKSVVRSFEPDPGKQTCAGDIQVRPATRTTIAVTLVNYVGAPKSFGTVMFRDGALLPSAAKTYGGTLPIRVEGPYKLAFLDASRLVAYATFTSDSQLQWYDVNDQGITYNTHRSIGGYSAWGEAFEAFADTLVFSRGFVAPASNAAAPQLMRGCLSMEGFVTHAPDSATIYCAGTVPQRQRQRLKDVEFQVDQWSLSGQRVLRRARVNLHGVIPDTTVVSPSIEVLDVKVLPGGQIIVALIDSVLQVPTLVSLRTSDLVDVVAPTIQYQHKEASGVTVDWFDLPTDGLTFNPARNRLYGLVPGAYGPQGSSLVEIDMISKRVQRFLLLDREQRRMTLSKDGRYAYVASDHHIDQIDLQTWSRGWTWTSDDGGIFSLDSRPSRPEELAVLTQSKVHWVARGTTVASTERTASIDIYSGDVFFRTADSLAEFVPSLTAATPTYTLSDANATLTSTPATFMLSSFGANSFAANAGLAYSMQGEAVDLLTLTDYANAPAMTAYVNDFSVGGYTTHYPGGGDGSGGLTVDHFAALTRDRYLIARTFNAGVMFDVNDGLTRSLRFVIADPYNLESPPIATLAPIDASHAAFSQVAGGGMGVGATYILGF